MAAGVILPPTDSEANYKEMNLIPFVLTFLAIVFGTVIAEFEIGLLFGLIVGLVSLQRETHLKIVSLEEEIRYLREGPPSASQQEPEAEPEPEPEPGPESELDSDPVADKYFTDSMQSYPVYSRPSRIPPQPERALQFESPQPEPAPSNEPSEPKSDGPTEGRFELLVGEIKYNIWTYFNDGNLFVRVGLLILFVGVAFLLKYAAENPRIPLEYRFLGAAMGGLALLIFGWRLRIKKPIYALLLQGGGIGIIYITIFAAFRIGNLIPSTLTFILLVAFAVFTAALSVLQNSRALAIFAVLGGFVAPFLASSGSGNYIGLFSYYAVLNAVVFVIAWFKSWRMLNLLGFVFTFSVFTLWVLFSYKTTMLAPAMGFLLLFFAMYSLIGILYALKQTHSLKGIVDGTLVFGTPIIASSLMMVMVRHIDYGIALAAIGIGFYYVLLARILWKSSGEVLRLLAEAMLAIGVVFTTLAIPYALDGHWTSATWALEAAGILWISIRQQRVYAQWFAMALQIGAGLLFLLRNADDIGNIAWINPAFLGGVFIALGAFLSARLLYGLEHKVKLRRLHSVFFIWAMCWWLGTALIQIEEYANNQIVSWLLLFSMTTSVLGFFDKVRRRNWLPASISCALLLPVLVLISLESIYQHQHVLVLPDALIWILAGFVNYRLIVHLEGKVWPQWTKVLLHSGFVFFVACVLSLDLKWYFDHEQPGVGQGFIALLTVFPLIFMYLARKHRFPAILRFGLPLQLGIIVPLALIMALWSIVVNFTNTASPAQLPYLPFINPVDLAHLVLFISVMRALELLQPPLTKFRNHVLIFLGGIIFIWLSAVLMRSMHHFADIPFNLAMMLKNTQIQTALSILWTVIGMLGMLFASRRSLRPVWIAGAVLIAVVIIKMFFIDLDASGTVERIVSFLVVGGLLVAMGYFSPIPHKRVETKLATEGISSAI